MTRIFHNAPLNVGTVITLNDNAYNHVVRVLRMKIGDSFTLFNGNNHTFAAELIQIDKKQAQVAVGETRFENRESPLAIHLGQVISMGSKMDLTIQKSVELGVQSITPLFAARCGVKLDGERLKKRVEQWQNIVISACEQCGRNQIPVVNAAVKVGEWCANLTNGLKLNLHPRAQQSINTLVLPTNQIHLLIGPEGGLSPDEISMATQHGFIDLLLGPRILRTETAALCAIAALQTKFGDLG